MGTNFVRLSAEQAPNAEGGSNTVSSVNFDIPATEFTMNPNVELLERNDEMRGASGELPHLGAAAYNPEFSLPTRLYPGSLGILLLLACGGVTTTEGDGATVVDPDSTAIPSSAYRHVFSWDLTNPPQTAQVYHGNKGDGLFYKGQGVAIDRLDFAPEGGVWRATAAMKGLYWAIVSDPSITPSFETTKPFIDGYLTLDDWLSGGATVTDFNFAINNGVEAQRSRQTASAFPDAMEFADGQPWPQITGRISAQTFDSDDWSALVAGTTFAATIHLTHTENAAGSYKHQMWIEMPACQYIGGEIDPSNNNRRHPASFDWAARYDTSTSKFATVTLVNATSSLATYA